MRNYQKGPDYRSGSMDKFLQIPRGTESFSLEEAFVHRKVNEILSRLFYSWGYLPIETPIFDFYDIYRSMLDPAIDEKIYKLIDRDGDLLMLRSDITLFMAKQMGVSLSNNDLPVRVCYSDAILRYQSRESISHNEFFQVGCELIGRDGIRGDLEIVLLLIEALREIGVSDIKLHIGSRALFDSIFSGILDKKNKVIKKVRFLNSIIPREWETLSLEMESLGIDKATCNTVVEVFKFIGSGEELERVERVVRNKEIDYLKEIYSMLKALGYGDIVRIDLSEVGTQPYYTGISFSVYTEGVDSAVASGGRYNKLLKSFGFDAPAVGFSILLRKLEDKIGRKDRFMPSKEIIRIEDGDFIASYRKARELREKGKIVVL